MSLFDTITGIEAGIADAAKRLEQLGSTGTAGPGRDPPPFADGWYREARRVPAHAGRIGGPIEPWSIVVHTTDMLPAEFEALGTAWTTRPGDGACAHFLIGRDADHGVVQFVPIDRNGNHAGGPGHGLYVDSATGQSWHPNTVAVGIEVHCAGGVRQIGGAWRLVEGGIAHGPPLPDADVIPDPDRPGRGWHVITPYQYAQLDALLRDLDAQLRPVPSPMIFARSTGEAVPSWGIPSSSRIVGHVSLDPAHRSDPWPPGMAWLKVRG